METKLWTSRKFIFRHFFLFLVSILFLISHCRESSSVAPEQKTIRLGYALHSRISGKNFSAAYWQKVFSAYTHIAATGYCVRGNGRLQNPEISPLFLRGIQENSIHYLPLVNFCSTADGKILLQSEEYVHVFLNNVRLLLEKQFIAGIHLDFEYLPPEFSTHYIRLLEKLTPEIRKSQKSLSAAVFPPVDFNPRLSGFHDLVKMEPYLDFIVIMTYDYQSGSAEPVPVTRIDWAQKNIEYTLKILPAEKILLGIPAYGYYWKNFSRSGTVILEKNLDLYKKTHRMERDSSGCVHLVSGKGNGYLADPTTRQLMRNLAAQYRLGGWAMWRLGFEKS